MTQIIGSGQVDRHWCRRPTRVAIVQPVTGLDIVLRSSGFAAARSGVSERGRTQSLKQVIRCAVLLEDNYHVLKMADLCLRACGSDNSQKESDDGGTIHGNLKQRTHFAKRNPSSNRITERRVRANSGRGWLVTRPCVGWSLWDRSRGTSRKILSQKCIRLRKYLNKLFMILMEGVGDG